ncbi:hypothetical protein GUA46_03935 [Muricauda sp. HICW]|uniref:Uncharacterized protein n=1 Tax=Flagellimonas chongwuensis TaxID=2697365 RepID=A0A850NG98_9FLAO|nr:hypothetical protein [Allomuricauda chongwuensis]NVN17482.1 hypothetical protein [Allomuricauda chongwuensis]
MDYEKEKRFNDSIKHINGGFHGIVKTLVGYNLLSNVKKVEEQLLKGDEFTFNIDDLRFPGGLQQFIESLVINILEPHYSNFDPFNGSISIFGGGTPLEKSLEFVENLQLEDDEKEKIKKVLLKNKYKDSAFYQLVDIYDDYIGHVMFNVNNYLTDFSIEIDYRKKKFRQLLERLETAIENNKDLDKNAPKHLTSYVALVNPKFIELKRVLLKEFKEYIPKEEPINLGQSKQILLADLIDGDQNLDLYYRFEKKLVVRFFINKETDQWLETPKLFVRFYCFCESKGMFKQRHKEKRSGINILRKIYSFDGGRSLDYPNKRKLEKNLAADYFFLDV